MENSPQYLFLASGLNNGTRYYFRVAPVNTQGYKGLFSNIVEATPNYNGPVWWISNLGSNSNDGSQAAPLADLRSAFDMISNKGGKNDTIKIQPGNYTGDRNHSFESGSYSFQNPESMSIVIMGMGANPSEVVFSGNEDNYRGFIEVPPFNKVRLPGLVQLLPAVYVLPSTTLYSRLVLLAKSLAEGEKPTPPSSEYQFSLSEGSEPLGIQE